MLPARLVDTLLDRTVVAGYTRPGIEVRRRLPGWTDPLPPMPGRTVLITGATSGIGRAAAERFARLGATVVLLVRNPEKGEAARQEIDQAVRGDGRYAPDVRVESCDVSDLASVRRCAASLLAADRAIDVLVHDAGAMPPEHQETDEGFELSLATNVLGPFLLTALLEERLRASAPARVVTVSSGGMFTQRLDVDTLEQAPPPYRPATVYARAKRAQVVLNELWGARLRGSGVVTHAMHPGWVDTPGVESSLPGFHRITRKVLRSPDEGADTIVWLGAAPEPAQSTGAFWHDRRPRPTHRGPWTREQPGERERLWARCAELTDCALPFPG